MGGGSGPKLGHGPGPPGPLGIAPGADGPPGMLNDGGIGGKPKSEDVCLGGPLGPPAPTRGGISDITPVNQNKRNEFSLFTHYTTYPMSV